MADLNKFLRSKDRIAEILNYLMMTDGNDKEANPYISTLEQSLQLLDSKIEELKNNELIKN